jgi:glycolate oxidase FAD binding subunit
MPEAVCRPGSLEELSAAVRENSRILLRGGGTKPALSSQRDGATLLDLSALSGILEYEPGEFTFTALAGTPVREIAPALAEHGQCLPFDPPLVARGATLGGTVAAGLSGPGRYRYGGVRDFILGVRFVNGDGELIRSGGKVVKNAAGFDLSKLMVGSLGSLGVLAEVSFKVFPRLPATATVSQQYQTVGDALEGLYRLTAAPLDLDALDLIVEEQQATLHARLAGLPGALPDRIERLRGLLGGGYPLSGESELASWESAREFAWAPPGWNLAKVPLTPRRIPDLERDLASLRDRSGLTCLRRYSAGGQVGWLAWEGDSQAVAGVLDAAGLAGLVIFGRPGRARIGRRTGEAFASRAKQALDPAGKFVEA